MTLTVDQPRSAAHRAATPRIAAPRPASQRTAPIKFEYLARPDSRIPASQAPVIGAALVAIRQRDGAIAAQAVVDEARSGDSPLHRYFTWDDSAAAEAHRRQEARRLVRDIIIRPVGAGIAPVRAFYNYQPPDPAADRRYVPLADVLGDERLLAAQLAKFKDELRSLNAKYAAFRRLGVFAGVEEVFLAHERALLD